MQISIITATYNSENYLQEALTSYNSQTLQNKEIIRLLSDGSIGFDELIYIYFNYIDGMEVSVDEISFTELHELITYAKDRFEKLLK